MVLPSDILPRAFGLAWGMTRIDCLRVLDERGRSVTGRNGVGSLAIHGMQRPISVRFDQDGYLEGLEAIVSMDRSPWEAGNTAEQAEEIYSEYGKRYARIVEQYLPLLGPPSFSGDRDTEGFPREYMADEITYWDTPAGRIVVRWEHQDKDLPIMLIIASYPPSVERTEP